MADLLSSAYRLLEFFMQIKKEEQLWIVSDLPSHENGRIAIEQAKEDLGLSINDVRIPQMQANGQEPPIKIVDKIRPIGPVLAYTSYSLSSTEFRRNVCSNGGRFFSLPDGKEALALLDVDDAHISIMRKRGEQIKEALEQGDPVILYWGDVELDIPLAKRKARLDLAECHTAGSFGSPSFEVNTVPMEYASEGSIKAIAAVPDLGIFSKPVHLEVEGGRITNVINGGKDLGISQWEKYISKASPDMLRIAELGIGLNHLIAFPANTYVANESVWGTVHIGIGRNLSLGGTFDAPGHIDIVLRPTSVKIGNLSLNSLE